MWCPSSANGVLRQAVLGLVLILVQGCATPLVQKPAQQSAVDAELQARLQAQHEQAVAAMDQGHWEQARVLLQEMVGSKPDLVTPYVNLGIVAEQMGDLEDARRWYEEALKRDPAQPEALNQLAILHREAGQFDQALEYYKRALRANPQLPHLHYNLGVLYDLYLGDFRRAIEHYERYVALAAEPDEKVAQWVTDLKRRSQ